MKLTLKLMWAQVVHQPARFVLACGAMVAAACMVVWVVSGYDALTAQFDSFSDEYVGRYDLFISPQAVESPSYAPAQTVPPRYLPDDLLDEVKADPDVALAEPVLQARLMVAGPGGPGGLIQRGGPVERDGAASGPAGGRGPGGPGSRRQRDDDAPAVSPAPPDRRPFGLVNTPMLVGTIATQPPRDLVAGRWIDPSRADAFDAVLSAGAAKSLGVELGQRVLVSDGKTDYRLTIVGIVEQVDQPGGNIRLTRVSQQGPASAALYVPMALAERIAGIEGKVSFIQIILREGANTRAFQQRWSDRLAKLDLPGEVLTEQEIRVGLEQEYVATETRNQAYGATGMALVAGVFIVFTTLSMGVTERSRQLAMLRAIALTRWQVATLVAAESLLLAVVSWAGGLAAGWGLLKVLAVQDPAAAGQSMAPGVWAVVLSGACAVGGALLASIVPMLRAAAVDPLDAMAHQPASGGAGRLSIWATIAGLVLIAINPVLLFVVGVEGDQLYMGTLSAVGWGAMVVGFVLLTPAAVLLTQRVFGPIVGRVLMLNPTLVASELGRNLWRTVGTAIALSVGLGLFVSLQVWGYSMLSPFVPGDWAPDVLANVHPAVLSDDAVAAVQRIESIVPGKCQPLVVEQPQLAEDLTGSMQRATVTRQDNVIMIGVDPDGALGGDNPLLAIDFVAGDRATAIEKLKTGRYCIVPDHFLRETGLGLEDTFAVLPPHDPEHPVEYRIAAAVSLPGWHWLSKGSGLRLNAVRSAAMVFADRRVVQADFALGGPSFLWFNVKAGTDMDALRQQIADAIQPAGLPPSRNAAQAGPRGRGGVRLSLTADVRRGVRGAADRTIGQMSQLPLITLAIASLGVVNAILGSVRTRRWEMGVLTAVGYSRSSLLRLIVAEGVMLGIVACLLSLGFGIMAGWCGSEVSQYVSFFGGLKPSLIIPWSKLSWGLAGAIGLCLIASLWPAIRIGRTDTLELLQAGRASF